MALPKKRQQVIRNIVGVAVRHARERRGLSQDGLAAKLQRAGWDIGRTGVTKIELGERCVSDVELLALADCLKVPMQTLVSNPDRRMIRKILARVRR